MYFRLAYIFRRPISEIRSWPAAEILAWKAFFHFAGPLDWEREDRRDARRIWVEFGAKGKTPENYMIYRRPEKIDPAEKLIGQLRQIEALNEAQGNNEKAEECRRQIRRIEKEILFRNASRIG